MNKQLSSQAERTVDVEYTDGRKETLTLRPMPVARYQKAFEAFSEPDMLALVYLYANKNRAWVETLTNPSLTAMLTALMEGNADFFVYASLQKKLAQPLEFRGASESTSQT